MTTKEKVKLHALHRKVERGIITIDQAKVEFEIITGLDPDHLLITGTNDELLGEYSDCLPEILQEAAPTEEVETITETNQEAEQTEAIADQPEPQAVTPPTEKMTAKRLTKPKEPKAK